MKHKQCTNRPIYSWNNHSLTKVLIELHNNLLIYLDNLAMERTPTVPIYFPFKIILFKLGKLCMER